MQRGNLEHKLGCAGAAWVMAARLHACEGAWAQQCTPHGCMSAWLCGCAVACVTGLRAMAHEGRRDCRLGQARAEL
eukprot:9118965-Alexandrium_andersonii.AAC.1